MRAYFSRRAPHPGAVLRGRSFTTAVEHDEWLRRMIGCRKMLPAVVEAGATSAAPFLSSVDLLAPRLRFRTAPPGRCTAKSPSASLVDVTWPVSSDPRVEHHIASLSGWSAFRMSKFYEALDALTADVAYRHTDGIAQGLGLVTAAHSHSENLGRIEPRKDVTLRCYLTAAGNTSLEVRTDCLQKDEVGVEQLVSVCHTTLVVVDKFTLRPKKGSVPALAIDPDDVDAQTERSSLAAMHKQIRSNRSTESMRLRDKVSSPPSHAEMVLIHDANRRRVALGERPAPRPELPDTIESHTHSNSFVVMPEQRNIHGTLFGGEVATQAYELAYYAAKYFARGEPFVPMGLDEAIFVQPIGLGNMVNFRACVVHSEDTLFRVQVHVNVVDPTDPGRLPSRTNYLRFVFAAHPDFQRTIVPETYGEMLMHVDAARRHAVERPSSELLREVHRYLRSRVAGKGC